MKVLQINSHYDQGGAARIVATLHRQLLKKGIESYVAYGRGEISKEENVLSFGNTPGVYCSAFLSRFTGWNGYFNHIATGKLIKLMKKIQPDMIHMHVLHGYYINVPMLFRFINKHNIPCVWTFHDCHAFVGNCGYFFDCRKWEAGCRECPYIRNYPTSQWFDHTEKMWRHKQRLFTVGDKKVIVTPSQWLTEEAKKSYFGKYVCMTIHNGINTEEIFYPRDRKLCREKYGFSKEDKLVLGIAVGYRDPRKGAAYILQMAKDLKESVKVILIGWNHENDSMLEGLTNIIPIENTKDVEILAEYYSMVDLFVIPSLAENYATTTLEAMACGTPVVGFAVGGIPEQLEDGKGIAVEAADQEAFTEAVRKVLEEPDCVLRGEELVNRIQEENSNEKMVKEYIQIYESLLK